jgi:hypothetical protein
VEDAARRRYPRGQGCRRFQIPSSSPPSGIVALATDERRAMVRRDGVSVFEADIVIQSAKGISGRRDRRRLQCCFR